MDIACEPSAQELRDLMLFLHRGMLRLANGKVSTGTLALGLSAAYTRVADLYPDRVQVFNMKVFECGEDGNFIRFLTMAYVARVDDQGFTLTQSFPRVLPWEQFQNDYGKHLLVEEKAPMPPHGLAFQFAPKTFPYGQELPRQWEKFVAKTLENFHSERQARILETGTPESDRTRNKTPRL